MNEITKNQISAIHVILHQKGLKDQKKEIIEQISGGRTSSTKELTFSEAQQWIIAMNQGKDHRPDNRQRMVNSIIAMAHEMGAVVRGTKATDQGELKPFNDYSKLNDWMVSKSYLKKALSAYSYNELPKLVSQYKNIYLSWLKTKR